MSFLNGAGGGFSTGNDRNSAGGSGFGGGGGGGSDMGRGRGRRVDRTATEQRRLDMELLEARRQQRKLNFLITQTELYAHFMASKMYRSEEAEESAAQEILGRLEEKEPLPALEGDVKEESLGECGFEIGTSA